MKKTTKSNTIKNVKSITTTRVSAGAAKERAILAALYNKNNSRLVGNSILDRLETHLLSAAL